MKRTFGIILFACAAALAACSDDPETSNSANSAEMTIDAAQADIGLNPDTGAPGDDAGLDASDAPAEYLQVDAILDYVNPFVGTGGLGFAYGGMTPAAQTPLGFVRLGPDTTSSGSHTANIHHYSGYYYRDPHVMGFGHTHFVGTGAAAHGNIRVGIATDDILAEKHPRRFWVAQDKDVESASPGYYTTHLVEPDAKVELTATDHVGLHRYTFGSGPQPLVIDFGASVTSKNVGAVSLTVTESGHITGWVQVDSGYAARSNPYRLFVEGRIDPAPDTVRVWNSEDAPAAGRTAEGEMGGAVVEWDSLDGPVELQMAVSLIDAERASAHLAAVGTFDEVHAQTRQRWQEKLQRIVVAGGTETERAIFYTALYNTYRMPSKLDEGGVYRGLDAQVHDTPDGMTYYSDLSLWDTYRTLHPWMTLYDPQVQRDCLNSLLAMARDGGYVPRWPATTSYTGGMVGSSADVLFGESAAKGLDGVDYDDAWEALVRSHLTPVGAPYSGRASMTEYLDYGYIPQDIREESASFTLEYTVHDAGMKLLAESLGKTEDAATWAARSQNWKNIWNPETEFFHARNTDGSFVEDFEPARHSGREGQYTEGSAWQYLWHVPHDPEGLVAQLGGEETFTARLETFMERSTLWTDNKDRLGLPDVYYWHSNQPSLHVVYLLAAANQPERLDHWVREVRKYAYDNAPNGIVGNDDGGTLSAWYLFSSLGFYPVSGTTRYALSPPVFDKAKITFDDGRTLEILADDPSTATVENAQLDGEEQGLYIEHDALMSAETLTF